MTVNIYVYPSGPQRVMRAIAATELTRAKRVHPEARLATRAEVSAMLVENCGIPVARNGKETSDFAQPEQFGVAKLAADRTL